MNDAYGPSEELLDWLERARLLLVRAVEVRAALGAVGETAPGSLPPAAKRFLDENVEAGFVARSPELLAALAAVDARVTQRSDGQDTRFLQLVRLCALDALEVDLLLLALAPGVRRAFRETLLLVGDELLPGVHPAAHLVELCADSVATHARARAALDDGGRLIASGALLLDRASSLIPPLWAAVAPSPVVTRWLAGAPSPPGVPLLDRDPPLARLADAQLLTDLGPLVDAAMQQGAPPRVVLVGDTGHGRTRAAAALALGLDLEAQVLEPVAPSALGIDGSTRAALLDARLRRRLVYLRAAAAPLDPALTSALAALDVPVAVACDPGSPAIAQLVHAGFVRVTVPEPSLALQRDAWTLALRLDPTEDSPVQHALADLVRSHPLSVTSIELAATEAHAAARDGAPSAARDPAEATRTLLAAAERAARGRSTRRLSEVAERLSTTLTWDDLILPVEVRAAVDEVWRAAAVRDTVFDRWGMGGRTPYGRAVTALFTGDPGTGKTMVATLVARQLGLELYRVDLSRLVDKYIGETEKHLAVLFAEAERGRCVILFDEADAIFGKRTAKGDSATERYANLEVNYLLQRIETFSGICILTTNQEQVMDAAFKRRIRYRVDFPFPGKDERVVLWRRMLPPDAPLGDDIDLDQLAERYEMSGGHIKSAVLRACFAAASSGGALDQGRLLRAADQELENLGKLVSH